MTRAITTGRDTELSSHAIEGLTRRLHGPVLLRGDRGYEDARAVWNAMIERRPAIVAQCRVVADAISCIQFAREHDLLLCINGGGHNDLSWEHSAVGHGDARYVLNIARVVGAGDRFQRTCVL
jgi:hypothetical protein